MRSPKRGRGVGRGLLLGALTLFVGAYFVCFRVLRTLKGWSYFE